MQALEIVRATQLFTTHTPVPAGHDTFSEVPPARVPVRLHLRARPLVGAVTLGLAALKADRRQRAVFHEPSGPAYLHGSQRREPPARRCEPKDVQRPVPRVQPRRVARRLCHQQCALSHLGGPEWLELYTANLRQRAFGKIRRTASSGRKSMQVPDDNDHGHPPAR
jgi:hypothetical protein